MNKGIFAAIILLLLAVMVVPFIQSSDEKSSADAVETPLVAVTTFPLYEVVREVGGDKVTLEKVIAFGTDVHAFRPTPREMVLISKADLFLYSGAGLEPWSAQMADAIDAHKAVDMSRHVALLEREMEACDAHDHQHHNHAKSVDPHYWLAIENMITMSEFVAVRLSRLSPQNGYEYMSNAKAYVEKLQALKLEYVEALKECNQKHLVSTHDAFGYLAHGFGFETIAVTGLSSDEQPSAKVMAEVTELIRNEGIKTIFFEVFVGSGVSDSLARETGAKAESLQPLANISADEAASRATYISIMQDNLKKIAQAMECR